jgi:hypothetical protein
MNEFPQTDKPEEYPASPDDVNGQDDGSDIDPVDPVLVEDGTDTNDPGAVG